MKLYIEIEREADGRWIAEIPELPGCMVYSTDPVDAPAKVKKLALQILIDKAEHDSAEVPAIIEFRFKNPIIDYLEHASPEEIEDTRQQFKREIEDPPDYDPAGLAAAGLTAEEADGIRQGMLQIDRGDTVSGEEFFKQFDGEFTLITKVVNALRDLPIVSSVRVERVEPRPASLKFYVILGHHNLDENFQITERLWPIADVDYRLVPSRAVGTVRHTHEVYRRDERAKDGES